MKVAFISDIHGNLEALLAVKESLHDEGVDKVLFLGDVVGYGANPNECVTELKQIADTFIAGNHDWTAIGKSSAESFNPSARSAIEWTHNKLTSESKEFLANLPLKGQTKSFMYVHSTPYEPQVWEYIFTTFDAETSFEFFTQPLCFIAHSHYPAVFTLREDKDITAEVPLHISLVNGRRYIINSGSVGQPRDGNPYACYGLLDTDTSRYKLMRVEYDIAAAQRKIVDAGLPPYLATRLGLGR